MRTNKPASQAFLNALTKRTHEGARTIQLSPEAQLRRTVMANMLFEGSFYEDGQASAERIRQLVPQVEFFTAANIAFDARAKYNLRHVPLLILRELVRKNVGRKVGDLIHSVIQRPDELGEFLALYWAENKDQPLTSQMKIGLARALKKFSEYQLAKYDRDTGVKLRDVLFLSHARPRDELQKVVFNRLANRQLVTPDTWEVALSAGEDKKETFERLLREKKLGALALLRNLRNMIEAGVDEDLIRTGLREINPEKVFPYRFIAAAKAAPRLEDALEEAMFKCLAAQPRIAGKTAILVDHSGSMHDKLSGKSEMLRFDAACALAVMLREVCAQCRVYTFSNSHAEVPPRRGFALAQAITSSMEWGGTELGKAVKYVYATFPECERLIVVTDEQSHDRPPQPQGLGYILNVGAYQNGIGYGSWVTIDGWSSASIDFIRELESFEGAGNA